jgi:hypothetical protein
VTSPAASLTASARPTYRGTAARDSLVDQLLLHDTHGYRTSDARRRADHTPPRDQASSRSLRSAGDLTQGDAMRARDDPSRTWLEYASARIRSINFVHAGTYAIARTTL